MKAKENKVNIALVDDHQLVRGGIKLLLERIEGFHVVLEASNGKECLDQLSTATELPQLALIDVSMPIMDGYETTRMLNELYPKIRIIALSVHDDVKVVNAMMESGAHAYLLKDATTDQVAYTLHQVIKHGYYYEKIVVESMMKAKYDGHNQRINKFDLQSKFELTNREIEFIKYCCTELTYKEIADKMSITPRTVDGYRESVFYKLNLKSRTGIVLFAFHHKIYEDIA